MAPHVNLPLDILGHIADMLGTEDGRPDSDSLKVLSQTCKFMVPVCRRHLFASLKLPIYLKSTSRSRGVRNLLVSQPAIVHYCKTLYFDTAAPFCGPDYEILRTICASSLPTTVTISGGSWNHLTEQATSAILSIIQSSAALHLTLRNISRFPVTALSLCTGLTELKLHDLHDFALSDNNHVAENCHRTAPVSLHVSGRSNHALATLMRPKDLNAVGTAGSAVRFDRLKRAYFRISVLDEAFQMHKLLAAAIALESVEITGKCNVENFARRLICFWVVPSEMSLLRLNGLGSSLLVNPHPTLRSAKFHFLVYPDFNYPTRGLNTELEKIAGNNVFEELEVKVTTATCSFGFGSAKVTDWVDLDRVLTSPGAFPMLRRVIFERKFHSICRCPRDNTEYSESNLTEESFPQLLAHTAVDFVFRETCTSVDCPVHVSHTERIGQ